MRALVLGEIGGPSPGDRGRYCREGRDTLCADVRQHGFSIDGGMADYMKTPGVNLCKVPDNLPLERACILADAVATSYYAVTKRAQVRPRMTVVLVGVGGVGLHALQMARLAGARTIAVDINDAQLGLAQELGADDLVDARRGPFDETVKELTGGEGADVVWSSSPTRTRFPTATVACGRRDG